MADWGQKLSFYQLNGKPAFKDRKLGFDATQISWHSNGDFLLASGSNKQCGIYTSEGIKLNTVAEKKSWVLCVKHKPNSNYIVSEPVQLEKTHNSKPNSEPIGFELLIFGLILFGFFSDQGFSVPRLLSV